ncbi:MAG TPA: DinB family protein [Thermomicrobiales bacterium]|nr:DinB family protein [Thermomicrobiales bacterium]
MQLTINAAAGPRTGNKRIDRMLNEIDTTWADFHASYVGLDDEQLLIPGVCGDWSVRDLIAHVTWWDAEALAHLPDVLAGERPPKYSDLYGGIDAFNALMTERDAGLSLQEVRQRAEATHAELVAFVAGVDPALLTPQTRFRHRLKLDTFGHYPIHTADILAWRERNGLA